MSSGYSFGYIGNEDLKFYFSIQCVTFMYVRLIKTVCIYIVTKRVENSYSPGGLVQAKGYSSPRISTVLGRALSSIPAC